jgi:Fibronectin type III domain
MPTISQLPTATSVSPADTIPISQGGTLRSVSVGNFLEPVQPTITVASPSLIGRTSLGAGGPEQVDIGVGLSIAGATICATGLDHATFPVSNDWDANADLVACNNGSPALLPVAQLRNLFSAGPNVSISAAGVISTSGSVSAGGTLDLGSAIGTLETTAKLSASDLLPVSQSGSGRAISYADLLDGLTIDQAQPAAPVADADTLWVAQGSSLMERQTFSAVWSWVMGKMPAYTLPSMEVTANVTLQSLQHNGHLLVCSQPLTVMIGSSLPAGFHCTIINASSGNVTFGPGFVLSTGTGSLPSWQTATVMGLVYSGGTIAFVSLAASSVVSNTPGAVTSLTAAATNASTIAVSWQTPSTGSGSLTYSVQYRVAGTSAWSVAAAAQTTTSCQITGLTSSTNYEITVQASSTNGIGPYSNIVSAATLASSQTSVPGQVSGLSAGATSSTSVQLAWSAQSGANSATSYTAQYRVSGGSTWTWSITGITSINTPVTGLQPSTSYDFVVYGVNSAGPGAASAVVVAVTPSAPNAVSSITWNVPPSGTYTKGAGVIGVNAHVTPLTAAIQFGISQSPTVPPTAWTAAGYVNSDLWGAYVPTPTTSGNWYMWVEGTDGSAQSVYATPFVVQ